MASNKNMRSSAKEKLKAERQRPGSSNAGEYTAKADGPFAGPSGGAAKGTYPLGKGGKLSPKRIRAALALAHNAPNSEGIRKKVASVLESKNRMPSLAAKIRTSLKSKGGKKWPKDPIMTTLILKALMQKAQAHPKVMVMYISILLFLVLHWVWNLYLIVTLKMGNNNVLY
jgi:hypothetical protein